MRLSARRDKKGVSVTKKFEQPRNRRSGLRPVQPCAAVHVLPVYRNCIHTCNELGLVVTLGRHDTILCSLGEEQLIARGSIQGPELCRFGASAQAEVDLRGDLQRVVDKRRQDTVQGARVRLQVGVAVDLEQRYVSLPTCMLVSGCSTSVSKLQDKEPGKQLGGGGGKTGTRSHREGKRRQTPSD